MNNYIDHFYKHKQKTLRKNIKNYRFHEEKNKFFISNVKTGERLFVFSSKEEMQAFLITIFDIEV